MEQTKNATVVRTFDEPSEASRAIQDLHAAGYTDDEIQVDRDDRDSRRGYGADDRSSGAGRTLLGAFLGAILGGLIGAAVSGALPGIGALFAIDSLIAIIAGAAAGAFIGGILGAATRGGQPAAYAEPAGRTIVRVHSARGVDDARSILENRGARVPETQGRIYPQAGTETDQTLRQPSVDETLRVPLVEEKLVANKSMRQMGTVHVRKETEETLGRLEVDALRDEVSVEHVPVGEIVADRRQPWEEDGFLVVPIYEEQLVVVKRLVMKEQIRIRRTPTTERQVFEDTVRRERLVFDDPDRTGSVRERYATEQGADEIIAETWDGERNHRPVDG